MGNRIRILHIAIGSGQGGIETFLKNIYQNIDRDKIQFDFLTEAKEVWMQNELEQLGARIYHVKQKDLIGLISLLKTKKYQVVHVHKNSAANSIPFLACKLAGVPCVIAHSHNTAPTRGGMAKLLHYLNRPLIRSCSDYKLACSSLAAEWLYGRNFVKDNDVKIVPNGIEYSKFLYRPDIRNKIRNKFGIESNCLVIGSVGRLYKQKNPQFIIQLFARIKNIEQKAKLMMCGDGELKEQVIDLAHKYGVWEDVYMLGSVSNVNEILQAMDVFVMPSYHEGLPIVAIEAQAAGLPVLTSDHVTKETRITKNIEFLPLENEKLWVERCLSYKSFQRTDTSEDIEGHGYDILHTAKVLEDLYQGCLRG